MANCCQREREPTSSSSMILPSSKYEIIATSPQEAVWADKIHETNESILARDMNALTVSEREKIYEEIHGIHDVVDETPELVESSLLQMKDRLAKVAKRRRSSLDRAIFLKPSIANDDKLHLMFLRAERFDHERAAEKMCRYFDHKLDLFGEEKLGKTITLDDLTESDRKHLREGSFQMLTANDQGLNAIYFMISALTDVSDWKSVCRYIWYQLMVALEDEELQKRGMVEVANVCGKWNFHAGQMLQFLTKAQHVFNDRPIRIRGYHVLCDQSSSLGQFISSVNGMMKKDLRVRERVHCGSSLELKYALLQFGIRLRDCFELGQGIYTKEHFKAYMEDRRRKERANLNTSRVPYPSPQDVLMGRGWPFQSWHGNTRLTAIAAEYAEAYMSMHDREDKTEIAMTIVRRIKEQEGGQFLQRTEQDWEPVDDRVARHKVSQLIRSNCRNRLVALDKVSSPVEQEQWHAVEARTIDCVPAEDDIPSKRHRRH